MNQLKKHKIVEKPWGREIWFALVPDKYMGKVLEIYPQEQVSLHLHEKKEETMYLQQGTIEMYGEMPSGKLYLVSTIKAGTSFHILPKQCHSMKCISDDKAILFEVSTPYPEDSVRIKDFYGRDEEEK